MDITGKTAIVTGSASGIGRATAVLLAERGAAEIRLVDVDDAGLAETRRLVEVAGSRASAHRVDLSDIAATESWFLAHGDVDILHNNAGVVSGTPQFPDTDAARVRRVIDVNVTSLIAATQIAVQAMRKRGGGVIVNTVSTVALGAGFRDAMYATTKAAVMMFTRCCASLKEDANVRVAGVLPGLTDTPILHTTGGDRAADWMAPILANNERCQPEDIAAAVIDLIGDDALAGGDWVAVRREGGVVTRQWGHDTPV